MPMRLVRNHELRLLIIAAVAAAVSVVALSVSIVVRSNQTEQFRKQVATDCVALEAIKEQIRGVFEDNKEAVRSRAILTPRQKAAFTRYYNRQLARFAPNDCPSP